MAAKDPFKFSKTDFQLTRLVAGLAALATLVIAVVKPVAAWVVGDPLVAEVERLAETPADGAKPGVTLTHGSAVTAEFADAGASLWLASIIPGALFAGILIVVLWLLWRLLGDVERGEPFTLANVWRMRGIAWAMVGGAFLLFTVDGLANAYLTQHAAEGASTIFTNTTTGSDLLLPGAGFLIGALAEAFKRGVVLEGDVEGLV